MTDDSTPEEKRREPVMALMALMAVRFGGETTITPLPPRPTTKPPEDPIEADLDATQRRVARAFASW